MTAYLITNIAEQTGWKTQEDACHRSGRRRRGCSVRQRVARLRPVERAMATQIVMARAGDTRHYFDAMDPQALLKAEERFRVLNRLGFIAAVRTSSGEAAVTRRFDPTAEETLFFPRLVGG